jgi:predicted alpha/beta hydrolase
MQNKAFVHDGFYLSIGFAPLLGPTLQRTSRRAVAEIAKTSVSEVAARVVARDDAVPQRQWLVPPEPLTLMAADGFVLKGFVWRHAEPRGPVVIINPATSVRCHYYFRFAVFLFTHGFDVIAYDYRGIGESRPVQLRGFKASWLDWGYLDFEAVVQHAAHAFPDQKIDVAAHSIGGALIGLAPSSRLIERIFTMGAQFAYWPDYAASARLKMLAQWHVLMPLLTWGLGYFPGKKLGWLEDTPKGVVRDWVARGKSLDYLGRRGGPDAQTLIQQFSALTAPTLAVSITDDPFGTIAAVERLLAMFEASPRTHVRIAPEAMGETAIGHFAFFNSRFADKLWQIPLLWLQEGRLPENCPGEVMWEPSKGDRDDGWRA